MPYTTFVINLARRPDRMRRFLAQIDERAIRIVRVEAVDGLNDHGLVHQHSLVDPVTAAVWMSHQRALKLFMASGEPYALICEDDAQFGTLRLQEALPQLVRVMTDLEVDILQIGYIDGSGTLFRVKRQLALAVQHGIEVHEPTGISIRRRATVGLQAYLVSRRAAASIVNLNQPVFLPADGLFIELSKSQESFRRLRIARTIPAMIHHAPLSSANWSDSLTNSRFERWE